jgi:ParB-like chromosome segregation protein Spo0J
MVPIPVIVRHLDRDEATIAMVDANLKRENISPMERARAYQMKLDAMRRKTGRRSKSEIHDGKKPVRADQLLAEQTGESRSNIQKIVRLNNLTPELQQMVEDKKLPVFTASNERPVPRRQSAVPGRPVRLRRADYRFCKRDFDRYRRGVSAKRAGRKARPLPYII